MLVTFCCSTISPTGRIAPNGCHSFHLSNYRLETWHFLPPNVARWPSQEPGLERRLAKTPHSCLCLLAPWSWCVHGTIRSNVHLLLVLSFLKRCLKKKKIYIIGIVLNMGSVFGQNLSPVSPVEVNSDYHFFHMQRWHDTNVKETY